VTFYYACAKSVVVEKNVSRRGRTRILADSARKRNRKEVLGNSQKEKQERSFGEFSERETGKKLFLFLAESKSKTRINIGHQHDCCIEGSVESSNSC
jgi:hypothetical protein